MTGTGGNEKEQQMSLMQIEKSGQMVDAGSIAQIWGDLKHRLGLSPIHNQAQYDQMVSLMNSLLDEIGDNEQHPLADLLEIV